MAEIPDVVAGEDVEATWGNDIRDRTVQRYAGAAHRDSAHPTPAQGDLAWLDDRNVAQVFNGSQWRDVGPRVKAWDRQVANFDLSTAWQPIITLPWPTPWLPGEYEFTVHTSARVTQTSPGAILVQCQIALDGAQIEARSLQPGGAGFGTNIWEFPFSFGRVRTVTTVPTQVTVDMLRTGTAGAIRGGVTSLIIERVQAP